MAPEILADDEVSRLLCWAETSQALLKYAPGTNAAQIEAEKSIMPIESPQAETRIYLQRTRVQRCRSPYRAACSPYVRFLELSCP